MAAMGTPPPGEPLSSLAAGLIDGRLASGVRYGYRFQLSCDSFGFTITADPLENSGYTDHFFVDDTIIIRRETGAPATVNSLPAQVKCWPNTPAGAIGSINQALMDFELLYHYFPETLAQLGPPLKGKKPTESAANLIGPELASGQRLGYTFRYQRTPDTEFELNADPVTGSASSALDEKPHYWTGSKDPNRLHRELHRPATKGSPITTDEYDE